MLGRGVAAALNGDWTSAFSAVGAWLAGADVSFGNLESPLTMAPQLANGYDLRAPVESVAALQTAGFDAVSLANNHALDAGDAGFQDTVSALRAAGIAPVLSPGCSSAAAGTLGSPLLCFLAFDDTVVPLDVEAAADAVSDAQRQADTVVVSIHWGGEYQAAPSERQRFIARRLADAGARLIIGHGPHVVQRTEWVQDSLVAYSLGNFLFDQPYPADCRWGAILRVTLQDGRIAGVEAIPTVIDTNQGRVLPAPAAEAAAILARLKVGHGAGLPTREPVLASEVQP